MDYISGRERRLIELLLRTQHQFTTIRELAEQLDVSSRTVHRELKKVEEFLERQGVSVSKQTGNGIRLVAGPERIQQLETVLQQVKELDLQQEERLVMLLHYLIRHDTPVKTAILTRVLNVAMATLLQDLDRLEEEIEPFGLSLLRKRGYGIELIGSEKSKRRALANLMIEQIDLSSLYSIVDEHFIYPGMVDDKVAGVVDRTLLVQVERLVMDEIKELPYAIADGAYLALVIHISLAIQRIQSGEQLQLDDAIKEEFIDTAEYRVAQSLAASLAETFQLAIPEAEVGFISIHLRGANRRVEVSELTQTLPELSIFVRQLIQLVGEQVGVDFSDDHSLFEGLAAHLEPALHRAEEGLFAFNPLKDTIKEDYPLLYHAIEQSLQELFPAIRFADGELAFLVLHFASSLEIRRETVEITALVVCSSGIGTSKMLASRLQKEFPEITKISLASLQDAKKKAAESYDMIISTIGLTDIQQEYLLVSPLLPVNEVEKVKQFMKRRLPDIIKAKGYVKAPAQPVPAKDFVTSLERVNQLSGNVLHLLHHFDLQSLSSTTEQGVLQELDTRCVNAGLTGESGTVATLLQKREQLGGLGIPDTELALYHARSAGIERPHFSVYQLPEPLTIRGMDQELMTVRRLLLLLAPDDLVPETYELLSMISASIVEEDRHLERFTNGSKEEIESLVHQTCYQFIHRKLHQFLEGSS